MKGIMKKIFAIIIVTILIGITVAGVIMCKNGVFNGQINYFSNNVNEPLDLHVVNYDDHNYGSATNPKYACVVINNDNFGGYRTGVSRTGWLGEILIGGSQAGYGGHFYWNATHDSGYCLDKSGEIEGTAVNNRNFYVNKGDLYNNTIVSETVQHKLEWLFDNIARVNIAYVNDNESLEAIPISEENFYKKNLADIIVRYVKNPSGGTYTQQEAELIISKIDNPGIFYAQQWAVWKFVSPGVKESGRVFNKTEEEILYNALVAGANANANYISSGNEKIEVDNSSVKVEEGENNVIIGPIIIKNPKGKLFKFEYGDFSLNGKSIDNNKIDVFKAGMKTKISNGSFNKFGIENGEEIYIVVNNCSVDESNKEYQFSGNVNATTYTTTATYWESTIQFQPVATIDRKPNSNLVGVNTSYSVREGDYVISIKKIDEKGRAIDLNGKNIFTAAVNFDLMKVATIDNEVVTYNPVKITEDNANKKDVIAIMETGSIQGYGKYDKKIEIDIDKTYNNELKKFVGNVGEVRIDDEVAEGKKVTGGFSYDNDNVIISWTDGNISIRIVNKLNNKYRFYLQKRNSDDKLVPDTKFELKTASKNDSSITEWNKAFFAELSAGSFASNVLDLENVDSQDLYMLEETEAPFGYEKIDKKIVVEILKKNDNSKGILIEKVNVYKFNLDEDVTLEKLNSSSNNYVGDLNGKGEVIINDDNGNKILGVYTGNISTSSTLLTFKVLNKKVDISLRKMITKVADVDDSGNEIKTYDVPRKTLQDMSWVEADNLKISNNAIYKMNKKPVEVMHGQKVNYALMVFNEGEVDAKALEINDYIPKGLTVTNVYYKNSTTPMVKSTTADNNALSNKNYYYYDNTNGVLNIRLGEADLISAKEIAEDAVKISHDYVIVECKVDSNAQGVLTNVAEIVKYQTLVGERDADLDSTANNWESPNKDSKLTTDKSTSIWNSYTNNHDEYLQGYNSIVSQDSSVVGVVGDDDDFEKVIVKGKYLLKLNKVNASDGNSQVTDVLFNIKIKDSSKATGETFNNVQLTTEGWDYSGELSPYNSLTGLDDITIILQELENDKYIQLDKEIKIVLIRDKTKLVGYTFAYDNLVRGDVQVASNTFKCRSKDGVELDVKVNFDINNNYIGIEVSNKVIIPDSYSLKLRKVSSGNNKPLQGVIFNIDKYSYENISDRDSSKSEVVINPTDAAGFTNEVSYSINFDNYKKTDEYVIKEIDLGNNTGYSKINKPITLVVNKKYNSEIEKFEMDSCTLKYENEEVKCGSITTHKIVENGVTYYCVVNLLQNNLIQITLTNAPDNPIPLEIKKVDYVYGSTITGTEFTVKKDDIVLYSDIDLTGFVNLEDKVEATVSEIAYTVIEENAASGYDNILAGKYIKLRVTLNSGVATSVNTEVYNWDGTRDTSLDKYASATIATGTSRPKIVLTVLNPKTDKTIDLALKKIITEIDGIEVKASNGYDDAYDRLTEGNDKFRINTEPLKKGATNAEYYLNKTPILAQKGSTVKYQIRIYNESSVNNSTASKIVDYLPLGLDLVNVYYRDEETPLNNGSDYTYHIGNKVLEITVLNKKPLISKFDNELHYDYVTVECKVNNKAEGIQTNVAEIKEYKDESGIVSADVDSQPSNWKNPIDGNPEHNVGINKDVPLWINYGGKFSNVYEIGKFKDYKGQQDDDDFEKIIVKDVDLVLKKIITKVNDKTTDELSSQFRRFQNGKIVVDTEEMINNYSVTTAKYYLNKTPITCKVEDSITYEIRIYNEGTMRATASEITDYIPKGLTVTLVEYNGNPLTWTKDYTIDSTNVLRIFAMKDDFIDEFKGGRNNYVEPSYKTVTVTCKVNGDVKGLLTNVAEITKYQIETGEITDDRDSKTIDDGEWKAPQYSNKLTLNGKYGSSWANYYSNISVGKFMNYEGQQDDDDFEKIRVNAGFDIALKKVSAQMNTKLLEGFTFDINGTKYTTDENGITEKTPVIEMKSKTELDQVKITEIEACDNHYIKLKNPIWLFVRKDDLANGATTIRGIYVNIKDGNQANPSTRYYDMREGNINSFFVEDEKGELIEVRMEVEPDPVSIGNFNIELKIENSFENNYSIYVKKVDSKGRELKDVEFNVTPLNYTQFAYTITTDENGLAKIGQYSINSSNVNDFDRFIIDEAKIENKFYALEDELRVNVDKIYNEEKDCYELLSVSLSSSDLVAGPGADIELKNVKLKDTDKMATVRAKIENDVVTITIENVEKEFDLALRKFITHINGVKVENSRKPQIDASKLASGEETTADYGPKQEPVLVKRNDVVRYTIRVYNEGDRNGYADLIMDDVPEGLEMIAPGDEIEGKSSVNKDYRWVMYRKVKQGESVFIENTIQYNGNSYVVTEDASKAEIIVSDFLSKEYGDYLLMDDTDVNPNILTGFYHSIMDIPDSKDVVVEFKVKNTCEENTVITNYAQITEDKDEEGNPVEDRDSTPNVWEEQPRNDDQDIEQVQVIVDKEFDLALRKFISSVNGNELNETREPTPDTKELLAGNSTTADYGSKPETILVNPTDIVEYTVRVYNEGEMDGYAALVMDDIPEGVEMIAPVYSSTGDAENLNAKYRWKMYKYVGDDISYNFFDITMFDGKEYVITEDVKEADVIVTDYLSMEVGGEDNLIKAYDKVNNKLDYKDLKIEFKVKANNSANKEIINYAQVVDDRDKDNNEVEDRDSTPNIWEESPRDDDQDIEKIKVSYFDLALYKWVSKTIVTDNEKTVEYDSKHSQEDKTNIVNVSIPKDRLDKISVKFEYVIKVKNEGLIEGYAKEIKDHIPEGLKFIAQDNIKYGWILEDDGTITTDYLKDTLLKKDETAEVVVVLTWINGSNNLGKKVNFAEISEDYNEYDDSDDIDSIPNNFVEDVKEDDEDKDEVILTIRTGEVYVYAFLALGVTIILCGGCIVIRKILE